MFYDSQLMQTQDMEHILKILTLAESAGRIGIVLGPEADDTELLAAHALKEKLGEKSSILNAPDHLQDRWSHLFKKERPRKEFALALNTEKHPVDELRYEKEGGKLRIFLSLQNELTKDAFELEQRYPPSDMIITLGFRDQAAVAETLEADAPLKNKDALINLSHAAYAVTPTQEPPQEIPAHQPVNRLWSIGAMKLWSRALLRSYTDDATGAFWAFLPKEDFKKTEQNTDILPALTTDMRATMQLPPLCIVLWQEEGTPADTVHILVSGTDRDTLMRLSRETETSLANGNLIIHGFANFSEAEAEMRKLLKNLKPEA